MTYGDFYSDRKYCTHCQAYVAYLASPLTCYCAQCGGEVRILSPRDWEAFNHERSTPAPRKPEKAGRKPKKRQSA
ncbi:MAG: hypothetical protein R3F17_12260 [Planctomycetota bacterium]